MSTSLPTLVCFIICFGECITSTSITIDIYIEVFMNYEKEKMLERYPTRFNSYIVISGKCFDLNVYLRVSIRIFQMLASLNIS